MQKDLEHILKKGSQDIGVILTQEMIQKFLVYLKELKEWNEKINLTSLRNDTDIIIKHFIDSLSLIPYLIKEGSLLDIGSGAGFPGIPLKIVCPSLTVTLLEATRKKVGFQKHLIRTLGLAHITAIHGRAEMVTAEALPELKFDLVTSRASLSLERFLTLGNPFVKKGGYLVAMKGEKGKEELKESQGIIETLSLETCREVAFTLPFEKGKRHLIFLKKR